MRCVVFFNDTATTEIYTLSLHDALPISRRRFGCQSASAPGPAVRSVRQAVGRGARSSPTGSGQAFLPSRWRGAPWPRSEEHTSELQSRQYLVCRLLLEKKKELDPRHITS